MNLQGPRANNEKAPVIDDQAIGNRDLTEDRFLADLRLALRFQAEHREIHRATGSRTG